jgi:hypothetical protein
LAFINLLTRIDLAELALHLTLRRLSLSLVLALLDDPTNPED